VPIHLRAEPGDYAPAVLLPGDPLRAERIAREFMEGARQVNGERGMLGFTGTFEGRLVSVQATGMGCPSAAIVIEELIQLGAQRLIRVGTCGGLQPDLALGDLIVAVSAVPADGTARAYVNGEPHAPTADFGLTHGMIHAAKGFDLRPKVGPVASSDTFYDPDAERHHRWSARGVLGVEMEAAVLFTIGALRKVAAACVLTVSDLVIGEAFERITDAELAAAVERMTRLALTAAVAER
jgi:DeoD family purine-nucleoside phosphorylase